MLRIINESSDDWYSDYSGEDARRQSEWDNRELLDEEICLSIITSDYDRDYLASCGLSEDAVYEYCFGGYASLTHPYGNTVSYSCSDEEGKLFKGVDNDGLTTQDEHKLSKIASEFYQVVEPSYSQHKYPGLWLHTLWVKAEEDKDCGECNYFYSTKTNSFSYQKPDHTPITSSTYNNSILSSIDVQDDLNLNEELIDAIINNQL